VFRREWICPAARTKQQPGDYIAIESRLAAVSIRDREVPSTTSAAIAARPS
jgi:hypothetical protein